jgi:hypothetical protein
MKNIFKYFTLILSYFCYVVMIADTIHGLTWGAFAMAACFFINLFMFLSENKEGK